MSKAALLLIPIGIMIILVIGGIGIYNGLVIAQDEGKKAWVQMENQHQRRADLIPKLVETIKGYTQHERGLIEEISRLRLQWSGARQSGHIPKTLEATAGLDRALGRLMMVVEKYPGLKSNPNFIRLQDQMEGTENRIRPARQRYNEAVMGYNKKVRTFPGAVLAGFFGFEQMPLFAAEEKVEKAPTAK